MSPELTQYVAYVAAMFLTPAVGFTVLGGIWLVRTCFERVARFPS